MLESAFKAKMVKWMRDEGGYARRYEDQFAVGIPDMVMIPRNGRVYFTEAKIAKGNQKFGATPRQFEELRRLEASSPYVSAVLAVHHNDTKAIRFYVPTLEARWNEELPFITVDKSRALSESLLMYYGATNGVA